MNERQRGVAIVLAMGVVALAAMAATAIAVSQSTWSRRNQLSSEHVQAQTMVGAGVDWARAVLSDDRRSSIEDHLGEPWALRLPAVPVDNGELVGRIDDEQGKFNLNNLVNGGKVDAEQLKYFQRLLSMLGLPEGLADALVDWLDVDGEKRSGDGAEDEYYLALDPPHLAANRPLIDLDELAQVRGFDAAARARLRPFVTALPQFTPINVNTASPEIIAAIAGGMDIGEARTIAAERDRIYYRNRVEFINRLPAGQRPPSKDVDVGSRYFLASLRVTIGDAQARGSALLDRPDIGWPAVVWRKYS